jgi:beta-ketodecanoyl-[acyl-carrier-protein] synthase
MDKSGVLDPKRLHPRLQARPDNEISLMAEIGVAAAREALARAGRQPEEVDGVICAAANMQSVDCPQTARKGCHCGRCTRDS